MFQQKICSRLVSLLLVVIFLSGNILSCSRKPVSSAYTNDVFVPFRDDSFSSEYITEFTVFSEDEFSEEYIALFTVFLEDKFHADVNDIFISYITLDEYNELSFQIDPVRQLDVRKIVTNLVIGGVIILVCVSLPALMPGLAPPVATLLVAVPQKALISGAVSAAISGVISYVKNDGDLKEAFYDAVEGGSEGFKYGAIFAAGEAAFAAVRYARNAQKIREQSMALINRLPESERYALLQYADDGTFTGKAWHDSINTAKRLGNPLSPDDLLVDRNLSSVLSRTGLADDVVAFRGSPVSPEMEALMGHNIRDSSGRVIFDKLASLEGKSIIEKGYLSTSLSKDAALNFRSDILMEVFTPKGTQALHLGPQINPFGEDELLMAAGQVLKFGKARIENGIPVIQVFIGEAAAALPSLAVPAAAAASALSEFFTNSHNRNGENE